MMFGREINQFIPSFPTVYSWAPLEGVAEKDAMIKWKKGEYTNESRHAKANEILPGVIVLKKNITKGTTQPNFEEEEFQVIGVRGKEIEMQSTSSAKQSLRKKI